MFSFAGKPGQCPQIRPGTIGLCAQLCENDWQCTGQEKCCFNGCGVQCMDPV
uniref:WAP domain-containing protein n=1 Tax=Laticauda laticaudata TaxID=8630 RepID=A0A8C5R9L3_LATLA